MEWSYRIIKHDTNGSIYFAIHEVFYDEDGTVANWTAEPISIVGDTKKEVIDSIKMMVVDTESPVLSEKKLLNRVRPKT